MNIFTCEWILLDIHKNGSDLPIDLVGFLFGTTICVEVYAEVTVRDKILLHFQIHYWCEPVFTKNQNLLTELRCGVHDIG